MVFILGAGFSKGYNSKNMPLINEFLKIAEDKSILKPAEKHQELIGFIETYFGDYHNVNIEKLASILTIELVPDYSHKREYRERLYRQLIDIIIEVLYTSYRCPENEQIKEIYQKFGDKLVENNINIITFNYDLILDNILKNTSRWSIANGYGFNMKGWDLKYIDPTTFIMPLINPQSTTAYLKLHGSLNWGKCIVPDPYEGKEIVVNAGGCLPDVEEILPIEGTCVGLGSRCTNLHYNTFIVPPILSKDDFYKSNVLRYLWYEAKEELKKSKDIFIIGYSFPATDYLAEFLFRQSVAKSFCSSKKVFLINKKIDDDYKRKVEDIFLNCELVYHECDVVEFLRTFIGKA